MSRPLAQVLSDLETLLAELREHQCAPATAEAAPPAPEPEAPATGDAPAPDAPDAPAEG